MDWLVGENERVWRSMCGNNFTVVRSLFKKDFLQNKVTNIPYIIFTNRYNTCSLFW